MMLVIISIQEKLMDLQNKLYKKLNDLKISYKIFQHEPLFTVEQAQKASEGIPGVKVKNLFLKDSKGKFWLFVVQDNSKISLKSNSKELNTSGLHFANQDELKKYLGIIPGAVTPLGIINDEKNEVIVVLDKNILTFGEIAIHPLKNDETIVISVENLISFIKGCGNPVIIHNFIG